MVGCGFLESFATLAILRQNSLLDSDFPVSLPYRRRRASNLAV